MATAGQLAVSATSALAAPLLADWSDSILPTLMITAAVVVSLWTLRRATSRRQREPRAREKLDEIKQNVHTQQAMSGLLLDLEEFSRRTNAQLDTKCAKLEQLIRDADTRIARLEGLRPGHHADGRANTGPAPTATRPRTDTPKDSTSRLRREPSARAEPNPTEAPRPKPVGVGPTPPGSPNQQVYELADEGRSAMHIAEQLKLPLGEVEFILRLRQ
jgi:hypothetical protein